MIKNLFLRFYRLRERLRYLIHKTITKNEVIRNLSTCVVAKFYGLEIVKNLKDDQIKQEC